MNQTEQDPSLFQKITDNHVDYSEMYRTQETKQLNKRLRKTRNILLICALAFVAGAGVFWIMPETTFTTKDFLVYLGLAALMVMLSIYSNKHPFFSIASALVICLGFWGFEIFLNNINELVIETSIHKLFIVSILVWCFHSSREAELIRKELHFS
jgi:peptidoglycan/LPS O-acetylase OafA/YrhL